MFLNDVSEFGRRVNVSKTKASVKEGNSRSGIYQDSIKGGYSSGDIWDINSFRGRSPKTINGKLLPFAKHGGVVTRIEKVKSNLENVGTFDKDTKTLKTRYRDSDKKPIKLTKEESQKVKSNVKQAVQPTKTSTPVKSTPKPSAKKSSKFINKYSLGALGTAGVLGGGYLGYRAYQNRKNEGKK